MLSCGKEIKTNQIISAKTKLLSATSFNLEQIEMMSFGKELY